MEWLAAILFAASLLLDALGPVIVRKVPDLCSRNTSTTDTRPLAVTQEEIILP